MRSIAMRLWLGMMALVAVVLILLWLFQIVFLNSFYTSFRIGEVEKAGLRIIEDISDQDSFRNQLDELAYKNNLTAELYDKELNTVYTAGESGAAGQMPMMHNAVRSKASGRVLEGEKVRITMEHPRFSSEFVLIGLPVTISGEVQGALLMTLPLAPVEDAAGILKKQLLYISIVLISAALLLSYFISRSFTKPILDINRVSADMASGNLKARIETERKDEIGKLAETINYMGSELSKIDQLRKDLIANVSHELRTPLSLIKGYAETIRDISGSNEAKRGEQIGIIIEEADRLSGIVEDILNFSQMQSGYLPVINVRFNLYETLERVRKRYELLSESNGVVFTVNSIPAELFAEGDEAKIEQVVYNLLNNAFNHTKAGDLITVEVQDTGSRIRLAVKDTGAGIPEEELPYIWERFYKKDRSEGSKAAGTGLGLAIVKNILTAHGARYGVESQLGKGSNFWFELKKG